MRPRADYSVYLVTDRPLCGERGLVEVVRLAVAGGVTVVQLREKHAATNEFVDLAKELKALLDPAGIPLIINDRIDVALAVGAAGAHVGQSDMDPADARRILGPDALLGLSVETPQQAREAQELDVDYLGVGPIFPTSTKPDACAPWGIDGFAALAKTSTKPLVAIGSVTAANAGELTRLGAAGVAVVSAICAAPDPKAATRDLKQTILAAREPAA